MKTNPAYIAVLLASIVPLASSCFDECRNKPGSREYHELVRTIGPSNAVAVQRFSELPVDRQITVFLYARDCSSDPRIEPMLIRNGEKKIPAIADRIETEKEIRDKAWLVGALIAINTECRCISDSSEIVQRLERVSQALDNDPTIPRDHTYKGIFDTSVKSLKRQLH